MLDCLEKCPLCDCRNWKNLRTPGQWIGPQIFGSQIGKLGLVRCNDCSLIFVNPRPSPSLLNRFYSSDDYSCHDADGSASAGAKAQYILQRIEPHLPTNLDRTLLDYGAGGGGFMKYSHSVGWNTAGFEPGMRGLQTCLRLGLKVTDDANVLEKNWAGLITMHHVFEHLSDPVAVLTSIRRYLAPRGRLYIEVPNQRSLRSRLSASALSKHFGVDERYRAFPIHLMYYNRHTLTAMLKRAGWDVVTTFTLGMGLDEFFVERFSAKTATAQPVPNLLHEKSNGRARLRHRFRDAFLSLGIGENLAVIAS